MKDEVIDLSSFEKKVFSQNGEDGVIEKIFSLIGIKNHFYVEFGAEGGYECNTRFLWEQGWKGLMMDGTYYNEKISLFQEFISPDNINFLFNKYQVPHEFDLLSIDIDYNDFYVWQALDPIFCPRVIVIEYNASHLPDDDKVAIYSPFAQWDGSCYYGASIKAMYKLGRKKGYSLVYAENKGVNLFFVRDDIISNCEVRFKDLNSYANIYKAPRYGKGPGGGHGEDPYQRSYISSAELLNC